MMKLLKKIEIVLVFGAIFVISVSQISQVRSIESIEEDVGLGFLRNVVGIDIDKYDVEVRVANNAPLPISSIPTKDRLVRFNLTSAESYVSILCFFRNDLVVWYSLSPQKHTAPIFIEHASTDVLATAKVVLNKIQEYTLNDYIPNLQNMLNTVTELKNSNITNTDCYQEITINGNQVTIKWERLANGLSNQQNNVMLTFENGNLVFFHNGINLFTVGNADVKIQEQEAIQIALENVRAYSYTVGNETVSNFNVLDDPVIAKLSLQNRGNSTLYPLWDIQLPLDKIYLGGVTSFRVLLWADTGEIQDISPSGGYFPVLIEEQSTTAVEYITAGFMFLPTIAVIGYLLYKKRALVLRGIHSSSYFVAFPN